MIDCRVVRKSYAARSVLRDVSVVLEPGICALLGQNGAGKSTLLRLLSGLEKPDAGSVLIGGFSYRHRAVEIRRKLGVVPEGLGLFEALSVRENVLALGPVYGLSRGEAEARTTSLLKLLDLVVGQHTVVRQCSFGTRKKTALAMALLYKPTVLLLDEPFEGIDPASSAVIHNLLRQLAENGCTILLTSHILPLVEKVADRILILHNGRLEADFQPNHTTGDIAEFYFRTVQPLQPETPEWLNS